MKPAQQEEGKKAQNITVPITLIPGHQGKAKAKFPSLKEILEKNLSSWQQKKLVNEFVQLLEKNHIFSFADWTKLTKETKDAMCNHTFAECPIPCVLRQSLDEVAQGNTIQIDHV
jgi:hypothetical protein